jgi:hypothetical protein
MKSKHERLPTHALILASRSGFTKEAREVARLSGIKAISFDEIERTDMHELLKGKSSLWHKFMTISPERVVVEVLPTPVLPAENVSVLIDHALFAADGSPVGIMGSLVQQAVTPEVVREYLAHGEEKHRWFQLRWDQPRNQHGNAFFLQMLEPLILREIHSIKVEGPCEFKFQFFQNFWPVIHRRIVFYLGPFACQSHLRRDKEPFPPPRPRTDNLSANFDQACNQARVGGL